MKFLYGFSRFFKEHWHQSRLFRRLTLLFILSVSALLAIAPVFSQQPVTLRLLMNAPDVPPWNKVMVKAFEETHPGIKLQIVEGPNATNLVEDLYTSAFLLGNSPYDLINMDVIWTPKFASAGWLVDLTDKFTPEELSVFSPPDVEGGRYQGGCIGCQPAPMLECFTTEKICWRRRAISLPKPLKSW